MTFILLTVISTLTGPQSKVYVEPNKIEALRERSGDNSCGVFLGSTNFVVIESCSQVIEKIKETEILGPIGRRK